MTDSTSSKTSIAQSPVAVRMLDGPVVYLPHEELSLVDAAVVLVRRWPWIVAGIMIGLGIGAWWISRSPTRYESRGVVRIGRSRASFPIKPTKEQQDMLLEPVSVASMRLREEYSATSVLGQQYASAYISNTVFDREADELLTLYSRASDAESAQQFLNAVMQEFVYSHQRLFANERAVMDDRLKVIELERHRIDQEIKSLEPSPEQRLKADTDTTSAILRQLTRGQFLQQKLTLEQEAVRLQRDIFDLQSQPTVRISAATLGAAPVEPRKTFLWSLGCVLGVIFGCALAFIVEFAGQVWRRLRH